MNQNDQHWHGILESTLFMLIQVHTTNTSTSTHTCAHDINQRNHRILCGYFEIFCLLTFVVVVVFNYVFVHRFARLFACMCSLHTYNTHEHSNNSNEKTSSEEAETKAGTWWKCFVKRYTRTCAYVCVWMFVCACTYTVVLNVCDIESCQFSPKQLFGRNSYGIRFFTFFYVFSFNWVELQSLTTSDVLL